MSVNQKNRKPVVGTIEKIHKFYIFPISQIYLINHLLMKLLGLRAIHLTT